MEQTLSRQQEFKCMVEILKIMTSEDSSKKKNFLIEMARLLKKNYDTPILTRKNAVNNSLANIAEDLIEVLIPLYEEHRKRLQAAYIVPAISKKNRLIRESKRELLHKINSLEALTFLYLSFSSGNFFADKKNNNLTTALNNDSLKRFLKPSQKFVSSLLPDDSLFIPTTDRPTKTPREIAFQMLNTLLNQNGHNIGCETSNRKREKISPPTSQNPNFSEIDSILEILKMMLYEGAAMEEIFQELTLKLQQETIAPMIINSHRNQHNHELLS